MDKPLKTKRKLLSLLDEWFKNNPVTECIYPQPMVFIIDEKFYIISSDHEMWKTYFEVRGDEIVKFAKEGNMVAQDAILSTLAYVYEKLRDTMEIMDTMNKGMLRVYKRTGMLIDNKNVLG